MGSIFGVLAAGALVVGALYMYKLRSQRRRNFRLLDHGFDEPYTGLKPHTNKDQDDFFEDSFSV